MPRWKSGDKVSFEIDFNEVNPTLAYGTVREVLERVGQDTLYSIKWDDGFDDGVENMFPEWELNDPEEIS